MTLYELSDEFQTILNNLEDEGEPTESVLAQLDEVESQIRTKADGYVSLIRHYESIETAIKAELSRLEVRATTFGNKARWLKQRLFDAMRRMGETKIATNLNTIRISKNGGKQPVQIDVKPEDLPEDLRKVVYQPDVEAIRINLEAGQDIPGCKLLTRGEHLRLS